MLVPLLLLAGLYLKLDRERYVACRIEHRIVAMNVGIDLILKLGFTRHHIHLVTIPTSPVVIL